MKVSSLTFKIAWEITSDRFLLDDFYKHANQNQFISFTHQNFFYSYPEFGKKWPGEKCCEFHQLHTCCLVCGYEPDRNYAGYGTLFLQRSGPKNRIDLVCDHHTSGTEFNPGLFAEKQLALF